MGEYFLYFLHNFDWTSLTEVITYFWENILLGLMGLGGRGLVLTGGLVWKSWHLYFLLGKGIFLLRYAQPEKAWRLRER